MGGNLHMPAAVYISTAMYAYIHMIYIASTYTGSYAYAHVYVSVCILYICIYMNIYV